VDTAPVQQTFTSSVAGDDVNIRQGRFFQLKNKYILTAVKSGLMLIDQKRAHERILFEKLMETVKTETSTSQKTLFPEELYLGGEDAAIVRDIMDDLNSFGLHIEEHETGKFLISGLPGHLENISGSAIVDGILADYKTGEINLGEKVREQISASMAKKAAMPYGKALTQEEMTELFDKLFACSEPSYSPYGKLVVSIIGNDELDKLFV
jgi:DNA mismatch repair protein MutL